jgi:hypothetical protein
MHVVTTVAMIMLLRDFGPYGIIFMNACCYNRCHDNAVKGFWALWDICNFHLFSVSCFWYIYNSIKVTPSKTVFIHIHINQEEHISIHVIIFRLYYFHMNNTKPFLVL